MYNNSAILIFANTSQRETLQKGIPSMELFENLNIRILKTVKRSGLPYFLITEKEQSGNSFGERFTNAIQYVFDKGFDNVISIGNDTPQLTSNHLKKTHRLLQECKIVLGPSKDGGFYLMGIRRSHFNKDQFLKLPWQTSRLTKCVERLLDKSSEKYYRLEVLQDIDSSEDLKTILHIFSGISSEVKRIIFRLLGKKPLFFKREENLAIHNYPQTFYNKGSPVILHF